MTTSLKDYLDNGGDFERHPGRHELVHRVFVIFGGKPWLTRTPSRRHSGTSPSQSSHEGPGLDSLVSRWTAEALSDPELLDRLWAIPARARRSVEATRTEMRARVVAYEAGEKAIEAFGEYQRRRNFSPKTVHSRRYVLASFNWYHGAGVTLFTATRQDVERWLDGFELGPQGRYTYTSHLHAFYRWAIREELTAEDPTAAIDRPRLPKRLPRPLTPDDLARALEEATDGRVRAWLCLGATRGFESPTWLGCGVRTSSTASTRPWSG